MLQSPAWTARFLKWLYPAASKWSYHAPASRMHTHPLDVRQQKIEQRRRQEVMQKQKGISRRYMFMAAASIFVLIGAASLSTARAQETDFGGPRWVATWSAPPMAHGSAIGASRSFENQTVRQIAY